mgnify:CR=1 FL=1
MGCYERTLALLIEKYAGAMPTWIAPEQVRFLPVTDRAADYCYDLMHKLEDNGYRVTVDARSEKIGKKIREAQMEKVPYMLVVGEKEAENKEVAVRKQGEGDKGTMKFEEFAKKMNEEVQNMINKW